MSKFTGPKGPRIHKPDAVAGGPPGLKIPGGQRPSPPLDQEKAAALINFSAGQINHINLTMDLYTQEVVRLRQGRDQMTHQIRDLLEKYKEAKEELEKLKAEAAAPEAVEGPPTPEVELEKARAEVRDEVKKSIEPEPTE